LTVLLVLQAFPQLDANPLLENRAGICQRGIARWREPGGILSFRKPAAEKSWQSGQKS
jgi:hypothetical protein